MTGNNNNSNGMTLASIAGVAVKGPTSDAGKAAIGTYYNNK